MLLLVIGLQGRYNITFSERLQPIIGHDATRNGTADKTASISAFLKTMLVIGRRSSLVPRLRTSCARRCTRRALVTASSCKRGLNTVFLLCA